VHGDDPKLRGDLETRGLGYVLATSLNDARVPIRLRYQPLAEVVAGLDQSAWQRLSAGAGRQGPRFYDWQLVELSVTPRRGWQRALLVQRCIGEPTELKVHRCFLPDGTPLARLVQVAGSRWTIETDIDQAKGEVGLDHYEVRSWGGWYRHVSLAMLAHALLAVTKAVGQDAAAVAQEGGPEVSPPQSSMKAFKLSRGLSCP
jgi:SRSO17 transposase